MSVRRALPGAGQGAKACPAPVREIEVRYQHIIGVDAPVLDEVVLTVDGRCLFHLEQMSDTCWWMGIGDPDGQYVHVRLFTKRATIKGNHESEGQIEPLVTVDGKPGVP